MNYSRKQHTWIHDNEFPLYSVIIPPLPKGGGGILFYLCPSVRPFYYIKFIFHELFWTDFFISNFWCWWSIEYVWYDHLKSKMYSPLFHMMIKDKLFTVMNLYVIQYMINSDFISDMSSFIYNPCSIFIVMLIKKIMIIVLFLSFLFHI